MIWGALQFNQANKPVGADDRRSLVWMQMLLIAAQQERYAAHPLIGRNLRDSCWYLRLSYYWYSAWTVF